MPDIEIVKLKVRRGTDNQRASIVLEQGELGYSTDAKRLWVGDGFTLGGANVGNIVHAPITAGDRTSLIYATKGDLVYDNNFLYQLSGAEATQLSSWGFIGSHPDNATIEYTASNTLHVVDNSIGIAQLNSDVVEPNGGLVYSDTGLSANVDYSTVTVNSLNGQLSVIDAPITPSRIGQGLSGGGDELLGAYTTNSFTFQGDRLEFNNAPANTIDGSAIQAAALGTGLTKSGDGTTILLDSIGGGSIPPFNSSTYDEFGRVIASIDTIEQNLSGVDTTGNGQIFFGSLNESNPANETIVNVLSTNSDQSSAVTISLSSAGFIQIASGTQGNFAIPVFKIPN